MVFKPRSIPLMIALSAVVSASGMADAAEDYSKALTSERACELLQTADILPPDYRHQVLAHVQNDQVVVSAFRHPSALQKDCKIDGVLLTKRLLDADPSLRKVKVLFYDFSPSDTYWDVEVACQHVMSFAAGRLNQKDLLDKVSLSVGPRNQLGALYGKLSYKNIIDTLGVVAGPYERERADILVRIDSLKLQGQDVTELRKSYFHAEDLARRGDLAELKAFLVSLQKSLDERTKTIGATFDRVEKLTQLQSGISSESVP